MELLFFIFSIVAIISLSASTAFFYKKSKQRKPDKDALEVLADLQRGGALLRVHHVPGESVFIRTGRV